MGNEGVVLFISGSSHCFWGRAETAVAAGGFHGLGNAIIYCNVITESRVELNDTDHQKKLYHTVNIKCSLGGDGYGNSWLRS